MNPPHPTLHSTRLENLGIEPYGARFDLDGRTVQIRGDSRTPLVGALQAFHQAALDDYQARQPGPRPGWFSRLKSWIGRFFQAPSTRPEAPLGTGPSKSTGEVTLETRDRASVVGDPPKEPPARTPARQPTIAEPPRRVPTAEPRPTAAAAADPVLRAVYADKDGVHLVWQPQSGKSRAKEVAMTSSLDSQLAQRLQDCYGHLAELGYKVAGLELVRPPASPTARLEPEVAKSASPAAVAAAPHPEAGQEVEPPVRHRVPRARTAPAKPADPVLPSMKDPAEALPEPGL